jgi:hypothetical protein
LYGMKGTSAKTPWSDSTLFTCLLFSLAACGFDAVATLRHIRLGVASEANPLMSTLIGIDPIAFFCIKMLITLSGLLTCYKLYRLSWARAGIKGTAGVYFALSLYHLMIIFI